ncbi:Eco57I restriction-modification methylase domain-containing protein [Hydrogenobacter hydrogenophilus]|uniref:site-specific DNA-methyltransferase (adenine-specific) n=1 Tax=Hydrogenobacter hydrogenophilus TaxID=35835 RepID=A0A285NRZ1_9AQUI|nr:N-6 DNA methylase [Hydrogenobacter hydrogenophilus]SNZ10616.1 N-6 DNA Methylase [Hydrogenobacter hydrogenophilus]
MSSEELLEELIQDFSWEKLIHFLSKKNKKLEEKEEKLSDNVLLIGELELEDKNHLGIFAVKWEEELSERTSKKEQFEIAKKVLDTPEFDAGIFVFYRNGNFRLSFVEKTYKPGGKVQLSSYKRYTYFVQRGKPYRTFLKRMMDLELKDLNSIRSAFSLMPLTEEFYKEIEFWFAWALKRPDVQFPGGKKEENLIRLITRLIFVWFLKEKSLVPEKLFDKESLKGVVKNFPHGNYYYNVVLQNLFFATLNRPQGERGWAYKKDFLQNRNHFGVKTLFRNEDFLLIDPQEFLELFREVPFVNGGLFECLDEDKQYIDGFSREEKKRAKVPDELFFSQEIEEDLSEFYGQKKKVKVRGIINILKDYNWTADESSPIDIEVSLDPELLGHIFENLLASYNQETQSTARKSTGSYYTPKEIVDFMVEEALTEYFKEKTKLPEEKIRSVLSYSEDQQDLTEEEKEKILRAIDEVKIIDPAVGSGAFPMGALHKLVHALSKIDPDNQIWKDLQRQRIEQEAKKIFQKEDKQEREELFRELNENFDESMNYPDYARKLYLIQNCIYGVDIQPIAIQICKLRFFLSLLIDQKVDKTKDNQGIRPLPHLETKFVCANTLIGLEGKNQRTLAHSKLKDLKEELKTLYKKHFSIRTRTEKERIKEKAKKLKEELRQELQKLRFPADDIQKIVEFDIFDQTAKADWFDPVWMFGVEDGFDIVIGNPPHGAKIDSFKDYIVKHYSYYEQKKNSASLFLEKGFELLKPSGILAYIVPKSITFVKSWGGCLKNPRALTKLDF